MAKNQKQLDIIAEVLKATDKQNGKASILRRTNLSYTLLCKYLNLACFSGLINTVSEKYVLTRKGRTFLEKYDSIAKKRRFIEDSKMLLNDEIKTVENMLYIMSN